MTITTTRRAETQTTSAPERAVRQAGPGLVPMTLLGLATLYFLLPVFWLLVASTKSTADLTSTFGLWFGEIHLIDNVRATFTFQDGIVWRWLANSALYSLVGGGVATLISAMAGYSLAKYRFRGREATFSLILAGVLVPYTALAVPLFLLLAEAELTNTVWSVLLPSMVSPFGVYLSRIYAAAAVPDELLEAGRVDGAGEVRLFTTVALRLMSPALITIFLFQFVAIWNNFLLPLVMLSSNERYPVTLGIYTLNTQLTLVPEIKSIVVTASLVAVVPLVVAFLALQRFWRSGLAAGSVKA